MPLHVVCRGEECRSVTSVIFPRRQMERWVNASSDIVSRVSSSVEDPEGVCDDPGGGGHEPGVDPEVEDGLMVVVVFVVTFVLVLELHVELLFEFLLEFRFGFLLVVASPVRAEGAGTQGVGDLGGGEPHVEGQLALLGEVRQLAGQLVQGGRGRRLRIRQFHKLEFFKAEVNVLVDEFSFSFDCAEIIVVLLDDFPLMLVL